jgi:hypothetical protein
VGITIAIASPLLLSRYIETSAVTLGAGAQLIAYTLLAVAGSGVSILAVDFIGYPALFLLAFGGLWISALQALVLSQYAEDRQGLHVVALFFCLTSSTIQ